MQFGEIFWAHQLLRTHGHLISYDTTQTLKFKLHHRVTQKSINPDRDSIQRQNYCTDTTRAISCLGHNADINEVKILSHIPVSLFWGNMFNLILI